MMVSLLLRVSPRVFIEYLNKTNYFYDLFSDNVLVLLMLCEKICILLQSCSVGVKKNTFSFSFHNCVLNVQKT